MKYLLTRKAFGLGTNFLNLNYFNLPSEALRVSLYDIMFHYLCFIDTALRKSSVVFDVVELSVCRRDSLSYVT